MKKYKPYTVEIKGKQITPGTKMSEEEFREFAYQVNEFDQNNIVRIRTVKKFDKRYRNPEEIALEEFTPVQELHYDTTSKSQYGNLVAPNYYLFIDEKKELNNHFCIGGIMISEHEIHKIDTFMKDYKKLIKPQLNTDDWYVKGEGKHEYKLKVFHQEIIKKENNYDRTRRWSILGTILENLDTNYAFHFSLINELKYVNPNSIRKERAKERHNAWGKALENLFSTLDVYEYNKLFIITDNIDQAIEKNFNSSIKKFYKNKSFVDDIQIIKKTEFDTVNSNLLQYVDINLYAITRFILPPEDKGRYNILVNFENYAYKDVKNGKNNFEIEYFASNFEIIKNIFHNIKFHTLKDISLKNNGSKSKLSSIVYDGGIVHLNFGSYVMQKINSFCTIRTREEFHSKEKLVELDAFNI